MIARALLVEMLDAVEREPELAARVRRVLGGPAPAPTEATPIYVHVAAYAKRVSLGERTVWSLVARGMPTIGEKRSRRVDVARADAWLREERGHVDDAVEKQARAAATKAARRAAR